MAEDGSRRTGGPQQVALSISSTLKVGHDTVDNVWLWSEEVDGVDIAVGGPLLLDLFNVCNLSQFGVVVRLLYVVGTMYV